jgi:hypothetical protein
MVVLGRSLALPATQAFSSGRTSSGSILPGLSLARPRFSPRTFDCAPLLCLALLYGRYIAHFPSFLSLGLL